MAEERRRRRTTMMKVFSLTDTLYPPSIQWDHSSASLVLLHTPDAFELDIVFGVWD